MAGTHFPPRSRLLYTLLLLRATSSVKYIYTFKVTFENKIAFYDCMSIQVGILQAKFIITYSFNCVLLMVVLEMQRKRNARWGAVRPLGGSTSSLEALGKSGRNDRGRTPTADSPKACAAPVSRERVVFAPHISPESGGRGSGDCPTREEARRGAPGRHRLLQVWVTQAEAGRPARPGSSSCGASPSEPAPGWILPAGSSQQTGQDQGGQTCP